MFKPLRDQILVKPIKRLQSRTLEVVSYEKYNRGMVVAVGPGERLRRHHHSHVYGHWGEETGAVRPCACKPGDFVTWVDLDIYTRYVEDGVEYRIMQDKDITFISEREFVDQHNELSDEAIDALLRQHNQPLELNRAA